MQNSTRYALSASLALVLTSSSVFAGVTTSASAAPVASSVSTASPSVPDFTPSGSKPKAFIINVLGSMLGKAMPSGWRAEQLANEYRYNHSFETIEHATGIRADATPGHIIEQGWFDNPQTKQEYELRQMELQFNGGKNGEKPLAPPITKKTSKFTKGVVGGAAGVATAFTGYALGAQVGGGIISLFGIDPRGEVCTGTGGWETMLSLATGVSCEGFNADQFYQFNSDVTETKPGWAGPPHKPAEWGMGGSGEIFITSLGFDKPFATAYPADMTASFSAEIAGQCANAGWSPVNPNLRIYAKKISTGEIVGMTRTMFGAGSPNGYLGYPCEKIYSSGNITFALPFGTTFDHASFFVANSSEVFWYPEGHALWTPGTDPDPERSFECVVEGSDGQTYTAVTETFRESGAWQAPVCPQLPEGVDPVGIQVNQDTAGAGSTPVWSPEILPEYTQWATNYPECRYGACKLDLLKGSTETAPSCFDTPDACVSWFEDPNKSTNYQCRYGMHSVSIEECYVYQGVFDPSRIAVGSPYSDPMTGQWSGGQSAPTPDRQALGQTVQDPATARSCNGMKIDGFDPVGFVMRPVQCALEWAFVPRPVVLQYEAAKMSTSLDNVAPGQLIAMLNSWNIDPSPMTGCSRTVPWSPANAFNTGTGETVLWDVCPGSQLEFLGTISRSVVAVGFALLVFLSLKKSTSATVDYR